MDKQTLSNYGWLVIVTLVLAIMLALATPFGTYVGDAVVSVANGFVGSSNQAMDGNNIQNIEYKFENKLDPLNPKGIIPEGATYTCADGAVLNTGDTFPKSTKTNDVYVYGDYKYEYFSTNNGWKVNVLDKTKTEYDAILESINNKPITSMHATFSGCTKLTTAPTIPNTVTSMVSTFRECNKLIAPPKIPNGVTNMSYTFQNCVTITTPPAIPNGVTSMERTFQGCTHLTTAPVIPSGVRNMDHTFCYCESLTGVVTINANPSIYNDCFWNDETSKDFVLTGSSMLLQELANTSNGNYRKIYDIDGNILKQ